MKRHIIAFALMLSTFCVANAQNESDTSSANIRTGWTLGVLPSVAFDADLGFQYGLLTNVYYFGNGAIYPDYYHSFYAEAARTTRNYGLFRLSYDSKYLIPNHRLSVDLSYMPDAMCDFYGFNGYSQFYNPQLTQQDNELYISRAFYKMQRDIFRLSADLQGKISGNWNWNVGLGLLNYTVGSVDVDRLNKGKEDNLLPDTITLYDCYVANGNIQPEEAHGGAHPYLHFGTTYDSRDRQQNPQSGIHADAFLTYSAAFGDMKDYNNLKFNAAWRQYITLLPKRVIFAYRVGTQLNVAGKSPFYINTYMNQLYMQRVIYEGLGGGNSIRGIMRNRILSDGFAYATVEFRLQLAKFQVGKELFYIGINPFMDGGMVVQPREMVNPDDLAPLDQFKPHLSAGCGLKVAMNDNFVLSVDWATALNEQDNSKFSNLYIKMGYMF